MTTFTYHAVMALLASISIINIISVITIEPRCNRQMEEDELLAVELARAKAKVQECRRLRYALHNIDSDYNSNHLHTNPTGITVADIGITPLAPSSLMLEHRSTS